MLYKISLLVLCGVGLSAVRAGGDYSETSRSSFATPTPTPYSEYHAAASAESKSYKEDDRRPLYSEGPSHARTGHGPPPKKLGPGPLSFAGHGAYGGVPLVSSPQRFLGVPPGAVIGYLAYPQPVVHSALPHHEPVAAAPGLLPSAAFSHIAYAAPLAISHYPKPLLGPGPAPGASYSSGGPPYSSGPSYNSGSPHHHSSNY